ncbi:Lipase 5 [Diplonema papillatum]|nr:Lipase 5 [Diplonema papillatum]|eukprot:gene16595-25453_t
MGAKREDAPPPACADKPEAVGTSRVKRCYHSFQGLAPAFRKGTRTFLVQLVTFVLNVALLVLWPIWGAFWNIIERHRKQRQARNIEEQFVCSMQAAETYSDWLRYATGFDNLAGYQEWAEKDEGSYNHRVLRERIARMKDLLKENDVRGCVSEVRSGLNRHMADITNPALFKFYAGTKKLIDEYEQCVQEVCDFILASTQISAVEKYACFEHATRSFGRAALLLSGGGCLGLYHTGVVKALHEAGVMPNVVSGSSAGSIIAAVFCTKTEAEVKTLCEEELNDATNLCFKSFRLDAFDSECFTGYDGFTEALHRLINGGAFMSNDALITNTQRMLGDVTFEEAYHRTGRILNIAVAFSDCNEAQPLQLNYISSPHVVIWSAVCASCSVPLLFSKGTLFSKDNTGQLVAFNPAHGKRYFDGSIAGDLPIKRLRELFNIDFFLVSQTNPHVVPFVRRESSSISHPALSATLYRRVRNTVVWMVRSVLAEIGHLIIVAGHVFPSANQYFVYQLMDQAYTGDITIWPGVAWLDYIDIVLNPSEKYVRHALNRGQRKTWPHISRIRSCLFVEKILNAAKAAGRDAVNKELALQTGCEDMVPSRQPSAPPARH